MKFFDILKGKAASSKEIVDEIVGLEQKIPSLEKALEIAEKHAIETRQGRIANTGVSFEDTQKANGDLENIRLDIQAVRSAIDELMNKLISAIESERNHKSSKLSSQLKTAQDRQEKEENELIKAAAYYQALYLRLHIGSRHDPAIDKNNFNDGRAPLFLQELEKNLTNLEKQLGPSIVSIQDAIGTLNHPGLSVSSEQEAHNLLVAKRRDLGIEQAL